MTRDEAMEKILSECHPYAANAGGVSLGAARREAAVYINYAVALGLLKLDEQTVDDQACIALTRMIGPIEASAVIDRLHADGFKIVKA